MLTVARKRRRWRYFASVPERTVRAGAAGLGGALHESFELTLPRFVRRSRLYEATAKNLLRVMIELVGGVEGSPTVEPDADAGEIAKRKVAGNVVEVGSIAAFGFSPLWLLAAASDLTHGSRVYLMALEEELKAAGVIDEDVDAHSVDELLGVLESTSGGTARLVDIPPLELKELRASLAELRSQRRLDAVAQRAGRTVDGAPPDGRRGEPLAARGLGRSRPGFPDLGAQGIGT